MLQKKYTVADMITGYGRKQFVIITIYGGDVKGKNNRTRFW
jgi:hypothetical protein